MLLTKEQILKAHDIKTIDVDVPEWGGVIRLSQVMGCARDRWEESFFDGKGNRVKENFRARMLSMSIVDEDGNLMFSMDDINELGKKSAVVLDRLFAESRKLNAVTDEDIEELAKNSNADLLEDSASS
jgi:hypothetical protein